MNEAGGENVRRQLMRLLHGELPPDEAREWRLRLTEDVALQHEYCDLKATWDGLSLPEPRRTPPGFARQVVSRAMVPASGGERLDSPTPGWVRLVAALALPVGIALGVGVGRAMVDPAAGGGVGIAEQTSVALEISYWRALGEVIAAGDAELAP